MVKKSEEPGEDKMEAVKSLFGIDNPFRRKAQPDAANGDAGENAQSTKKQRLWVDSSAAEKETITEAKISDVHHSDARKRKRDRGIIAAAPSPQFSDEEPIPTKRKKLVEEGQMDGLKKKNKRKRDEVELEYEKRKFGLVREDEPADTIFTVGEKRKLDAATADMLDTKDSFDDEGKLLRTVFVGNLPLKTKRKALSREFARFGEIESVRIRSVPLVDTKFPRKAAVIKGKINEEVDSINSYIVFKEEQSAHAALSNNMTQIGGNHIRVDMACPPRKKMKGDARLYDRKRTVFVGNLPFDVKDEELYQLFCDLSLSEPNVEAVRVIRDPNTSIGKGIAYVLFKTRDAANNICKRRDLKIRDRNLRVCHAKSDAIPSKLKEGPSESFPHRRLSTASSFTPHSGKGEKKKRADADSASYEGIRSSKTGVVKKSSFRPRQSGSTSYSGSRSSSWNEQQDDKKKRPAVAARKAKQLLKRKQSSGAPENSRLIKRARRQ